MRKNTKVLIYNNPLEKVTDTVIYCKPGFCINDLNINKDNYIFYVNGKPCDFDYKLKAEDILSIYVLPKDTNNTYVRQGIKLAAVLAVASLTQNWVAGWKMAALLSTNLIANYLLPDLPLDETTPEELLSGTLTEPKEGLRIPKIFGNVHFTPPMAARPHLNPGSGNDASIVYCVALGYGPLDLVGTSTSLQLSGTRTTPHTINDIPDGSITLGGTDIKQAKGVEIEIGDPNTFSIYDELVYDQVVNFSYTRTNGVEDNWTPDNVEHIQTMGVAGKNITINIHFPSGLYTKGGDNKVNKRFQDIVEFQIQYKKSTDTTWTSFNLPSKFLDYSYPDSTKGWIYGGKTKPFWVKINLELPTEDIYDIKLVRIRTHTGDSEVVRATFVWETLVITKSGQPIKQLYSPKVDSGEEPIWMAIKVKGKDRIKSAYDLKVNLGGYCFNGATKVRTQSPALAALEILTTSVNKNRVDPSKIDINSFTSWDSWCSSVGYTFNTAYYKDETLKSVLDDASRAGLGRVIITDQGFRAVYDAGAANATPTQIFTPRNSWNFSATQSADKIPDAVKLMYLNEDTATQDSVIVYNTGYDESTAFDITDYSFRGITTHDHAASIASFLLNTANLRPTTYKFITTIEALRSIVGDKVKLQHDSIAVGYGSGRVIETTTSAGNITAVRLDERIVLGGATSGDNSILFRASDGVVYISQIQEFNVETDTFTLSNPISDTVNLLDAIATVGKTSQETIDLVISDIEYSNDFSATITGFDAAPEVHNHTGRIPPYTPPAYLPPNIEQLTPPTPSIVSAFASIEDSDVLPDGTPLAELKALFKSADNSVPVEKIEVQVWADSSVDSQAQPITYVIDPWEGLSVKVNFDDNIYLRARSVSPYGKTSDWTDLQTITPTWTWPPGAVTNLQIENFDDKIKLSWDKHERPSVKEYEIRRGTSWSTATVLGRTTDTFFIDYAQGVGNTTYLVAPIDSTTNEVGAVASAILTVTNPIVSGLTATIIQNRVKLSWGTSPGTWPIDRHEIVIDGDEANKIKINGNNNAYWLNDLSLGTHTVIVRVVSIVGASHEQSTTFDIIDRPVGTVDDSGVFVRNWETDAQINELQSTTYTLLAKSNLGRNGGNCLDITPDSSGKHSHYTSTWATSLLPDKVQTALLAKRVRFQSYIKSKDGTTPPSAGNIIYWDANFNDDIMTTGNQEHSGNGYPFFSEIIYDATDPDNYIVRPGDVLRVQAELKVDSVAQAAGVNSRLFVYIVGKNKNDNTTLWLDSVSISSNSTTYQLLDTEFVIANDVAINDYTIYKVGIDVYHFPSSITDGIAYARNIKATIHGKAFSISTQNSVITDDWINIGAIVKIPSYATNIRYGVAPSHDRADGNGCLLDDFSIFPVPDKIDSNNIEQWISKAAIGDAYINSLIADKIKSGTISSEVIYVGDQSIQIDGANNWILIKDKQGTPKSRVVLGKTGPNATDYGITIYDENGNVLLGTNRSFDSSLVDALSTQNAPKEAGATATDPANMVRNGSLIADNDNFSTWGYDSDDGDQTKGCVYQVGKYWKYSDQYIPVDLNKAYELSASFRTLLPNTTLYAGFSCYDKNKKNILFRHCWRYAGRDTTLYAAANVGDTAVQIVPPPTAWDAPGNSYIVFAVQPDYSDLPNFNDYKITNIDTSTEASGYWIITLDTALTDSYAAGTSVGNVRGGNTWQYALLANQVVGTSWVRKQAKIAGVNDPTSPAGYTQFRRGTAYIKFMVYTNVNQTDTTKVDDVLLLPLPDEQNLDALNLSNAPREAGADNTGNRIYGTGGLLPNWNLDIIDGEGKPAGIQPVEGVSDRNGIAATADGLKIQHPSDWNVAYGFPAIPIDDKQRYRVVITHRSGQSTTTGLYLRFNELNTALPQGQTHVTARTSFKDLLANGPMPGPAWVTDEYNYTPTLGTKFASFSMYHWGNAVSFEYEIDRVQIIPIAKTASDIDYSDGTNVDSLKPKEPNADTTKGAIESVVTINDQGAIQNASWDTGTKKIKIDFANQRIAIGDDVYRSSIPHVLQEYNGGQPRFEVSNGDQSYIRFDSINNLLEIGPEIKTKGLYGYFNKNPVYRSLLIDTIASYVISSITKDYGKGGLIINPYGFLYRFMPFNKNGDFSTYNIRRYYFTIDTDSNINYNLNFYFGRNTDDSSYVFPTNPYIDIKISLSYNNISISFFTENGETIRSTSTSFGSGNDNIEIVIYSYLSTSGLITEYTTTVDIYAYGLKIFGGSIATSYSPLLPEFFMIKSTDSTYNIILYEFNYTEYYKDMPTDYIVLI